MPKDLDSIATKSDTEGKQNYFHRSKTIYFQKFTFQTGPLTLLNCNSNDCSLTLLIVLPNASITSSPI